MFLILRRIPIGDPRLTEAAAGTGVTDISTSPQNSPLGAVMFWFVPAGFCAGVVAAVPVPFGSSPRWGWLESMSPGAGSDGPPPGRASANDGSSDGVVSADAGIGACEDALVPRLASLPLPTQDTNSTMTPSSSAPSTTARRRQYTAGGRGPTVVRMMRLPYARVATESVATRRRCDTASLTR